MPARVIEKDFDVQPNLSFNAGDITAIEFQDCINIIESFERAAHYSATEESVFAPLAHTIQSNKSWAITNRELLSARLLNSALVDSNKQGISIRDEEQSTLNRIRGKNFQTALQNLKDDCIPCDLRIKLSLEFVPSAKSLDLYLDDIKNRIKLLTQLDDLLGNVDIFRDVCSLLEVLNFMCVPDLQRLVSILMALMFKVNLGLADSFSLISSLILPIVMPILSGVVNLLDQFSLLVLAPVDCILDVLLQQITKLNVGGLTQKEIDLLKDAKSDSAVKTSGVRTAAHQGIKELYLSLSEGRNYMSAKLAFYEDVLMKAITDWTGDSSVYMTQAAQKLRNIQLINFIIALIELRGKGGKLCQSGNTPTSLELDNFFSSYLNPNSCIKLAIDNTGTIRVEECNPVLYQIEEQGAKILHYEPENLLTKPVDMEFKCSFHTAADDIEKINRWISELNKAV